MEVEGLNIIDLTYNIIMLTGLPGSGKSMYAKMHYPANYYTHHIECDDYKKPDKTYDIDAIVRSIPNHIVIMNSSAYYQALPKRECNIVIDGYMPSVEMRMKFLTALTNHIAFMVNPLYRVGHVKFTFHEIYWIPNPSACMNNDRYRVSQHKQAIAVIRKADLGKPLALEPISDMFQNIMQQPLECNEPMQFEVEKYNPEDGLFKAAVIQYPNDNVHMDNTTDCLVYGPWRKMGDAQFNDIEAFDNIILALYPYISYPSYKEILVNSKLWYEEKEVQEFGCNINKFRYVFNINDLKAAIRAAGLEIPEAL